MGSDTSVTISMFQLMIAAASVSVAFIAVAVTVYLSMQKRIDTVDRVNGSRVKDVHQRLDRLAETTVKREEISTHFQRIETQMAAQTSRMDKVLELLTTGRIAGK